MNQKIAYCTIASANYLSRVEVLETSLRANNPDANLHVLLCEQPEICSSLELETGHAFISPEQVCGDWLHMAFYYDITECNTAFKPFLLEFLFKQGYTSVVYIDPDIEIFGSLKPVEKLLNEYDLVLTPHVSRPLPLDGLKPRIDDIVRAGQFNLGFIGIADSEESRAALKWWQHVCVEHCIFDARHHFFVDQFWADILPSYIQKFYCLRDSSYNVAYWNVFQRDLKYDGQNWTTDCGELKFFHFSGFSKNDLTRVSVHQNRVAAPVGSALHSLLLHYLERIGSAKWTLYNNYPYSFGVYKNGDSIATTERKKFLLLSREERKEIGNPFDQGPVIRGLICIDVAQLNRHRLLFGYRLRRYADYVARLQKEYVQTVRSKGFLLAHFMAFRFLYRKARTLLRVG
jgi:hypothetical protein